MYMQKKGYQAVLLEPAAGACRNASKRGVRHVICGTLNQENVNDDSIPQILLLDVLEHIENDLDFLKLIYDKLVPGGKMLLTVPAFQELWSSEDDAAGHYRRYTLKQIKGIALKARFKICYANYFFGFLYFPILSGRVWLERLGILKRSEERTMQEKKKVCERQFKERKGIVSLVLHMFEKAELYKLLKNRRIWFGSSVVCVLEKDK